MPANLKELSTAASDQLLGAVKTSQAVVLDGVRAWSDAIGAVTPSSLSLAKVPGADALPTPAELVELSFDFTGKLLAAQREFADALLSTVVPAPTKVATAKK
jgi:hypothetical protein